MKALTFALILITAVCHGQELENAYQEARDILKKYKPYFDSIGRENDKYMFARGYIKAIDSVELNSGNPSYSKEINYNMTDSVWLNYDSTRFLFRYYKKSKRKPMGYVIDTKNRRK